MRLKELVDKEAFSCAIKSLSILRYLTDAVTEMPSSVRSRMLNKHDIICQLVFLLQKAPWQVQDKSTGKLVTYESGMWTEVTPDRQGMLGKVEGQIWIALYNLLVDTECRRNYEYNTNRQETVLKLREYLLPTVMDQIPALSQLRRMLEELSMMQTQQSLSSISSAAKIELLPELLDSITGGKDWKMLAQCHLHLLDSSQESQDEIVRILQTAFDYDGLEDLLPEDPHCSGCGRVASQRCSRCRNEWYCSRPCQVKAWKNHKTICDLLSQQ